MDPVKNEWIVVKWFALALEEFTDLHQFSHAVDSLVPLLISLQTSEQPRKKSEEKNNDSEK